MFDLKSTIIILAFAAIAKGEKRDSNDSSNYRNPDLEKFLKMKRQNHVHIIQDIESQISKFEKSNAFRLETVHMKLEMLVRSLEQTNEQLSLLEVLTDLSKKCVTQHRQSMETVDETKRKINNCVTVPRTKIEELIAGLRNTKNDLANYYENYYEKEIANCAKNYTTMPNAHSACVTNAAFYTEAGSISFRNKFEAQMKAAPNTRKDCIEEALKCSYAIENDAIVSIAETNTLINNCMFDEDTCTKCKKGYTCSTLLQIKKSDVDFKRELLVNPFYKRYNATECLMLQLV